MSQTNDGGPMFPTTAENHEAGALITFGVGMSLRDHFAGLALAGIVANTTWNAIAPQQRGYSNENCAAVAAMFAYGYADAMLLAREA